MRLVRTDVVRICLPVVCDCWTNLNARVTSEYCQRLIKQTWKRRNSCAVIAASRWRQYNIEWCNVSRVVNLHSTEMSGHLLGAVVRDVRSSQENALESKWHGIGRTFTCAALSLPRHDFIDRLTEMSTRGYFWGVKEVGAQGWQPYLPPSCADWLEVLGASTACSPKGLSTPV